MTTQVLTINPDGGLSGLQVKRGRGLDLKSLGHAQIERASEIAWNERWQCWQVNVLSKAAMRWMRYGQRTGRTEILDGLVLRVHHWELMVGGDHPTGSDELPASEFAFQDYDDAVAAEIKFLNALRTRGIF